MAEIAAQIAARRNASGANGDSATRQPHTPLRNGSPFSHKISADSVIDPNLAESSPAQVRRTLEARLTETDQRIEEASKLGTSLVQQRAELSTQLKDFKASGASQIGPELRQKLLDIEREFNELGRQSARAFSHAKDAKSVDAKDASHRPSSPSKFSSQATDSPSKLHMPRKSRNQASDSEHMEFAAEMTSSLLGQVRDLQALLVEREETIKSNNADNARRDSELKGFAQRLKHYDESEQRYKDENWNLETQLQEMQAFERNARLKEGKFQQVIASMTTERSANEKELEDMKQLHGKALEDHSAVRKHQEAEMASLRKLANLAESDKNELQRKLDDLQSHNAELAHGLANRQREPTTDPTNQANLTNDDFGLNWSDREQSPPPSPSKGQRNTILDVETLKSSLHHAHRMIQSLKSTVARERSEKQDVKRMLQEAQDDAQIRRMDPNEKKSKTKPEQRRLGKAGLGAARSSKTDITMQNVHQDPEWEDHDGTSPSRLVAARPTASSPQLFRTDSATDSYRTANESDAFETANERDTTDVDAFQTGAESLAGESSDELTETEAGTRRVLPNRAAKSTSVVMINKAGQRTSIQSTASTSDEEESNATTPVTSQAQRFRLKLSRRSRAGTPPSTNSGPNTAKSSPASFANAGTVGGQSLFAELQGASEGEDTPSKSSIYSATSAQSPSNVARIGESESSLRQQTPLADVLNRSSPRPGTADVNKPSVVVGPEPNLTKQSTQTQTTPSLSQREKSSLGSTLETPSKSGPIQDMPESPVLSASLQRDLTPYSETNPLPEIVDQKPLNLVAKQLPIEPATPQQASNHSFETSPDTVGKGKDNSGKKTGDAATGGLLTSVFGWRRSRSMSVHDTPDKTVSRKRTDTLAEAQQTMTQSDQASQTVLTAAVLDRLMAQKATYPPSSVFAMKPLSDIGAASVIPFAEETPNRIRTEDVKQAEPYLLKDPPNRNSRRPGSAASAISAKSRSAQHPPLPPDHQEAIAAAAQRSHEPMGPPPLPPSAAYSRSLRSRANSRPQTPSQQGLASPGPSRAGTTPRAPRYSNTRSMTSRRSSVSSFASELDQRFNIRTDGTQMGPHGMPMSADPRMIQAITYTMYGEMMWKYTRKAGRGGMSDSRHLRFFWIHPYTRTLYWSDRHPATGNRAELKSKSVSIQEVRVVNDDNPFPPGLHQKSIIVVTPGRLVKFTAQTSQHHTTWFNALSFVLLRTNPDSIGAPVRAGSISGNNETFLIDEDTTDAIPDATPDRGAKSRASFSSLRNTGNRQTFSSLSSRNSMMPPPPPPATAAVLGDPRLIRRADDGDQLTPGRGSVRQRLSRSLSRSRGSQAMSYNAAPTPTGTDAHASMSSRMSGHYWKQPGSIRNSLRSRDPEGSTMTANDSAEDLRRVIQDREQEGHIENVRACCDGRHDVAALSKSGPTSASAGMHNSARSHRSLRSIRNSTVRE